MQGRKRANTIRKKISQCFKNIMPQYVCSNIKLYLVGYVGEYRLVSSSERMWRVRVGQEWEINREIFLKTVPQKLQQNLLKNLSMR